MNLPTGGRAAAITTAVLCGCALVGCSTDVPETTEAVWSQPAWMAEQTQRLEEIDQSVQVCLDRKGWDVPIEDSGIELTGLSDADKALVEEDWHDCLEETPGALQPPLTPELLRDTIYPRELDIYECLKVHDVEVEDPPPVDVFIDDYLSDEPGVFPWLAWSKPFDTLGQPGGMTNAEYDELSAECPQVLLLP